MSNLNAYLVYTWFSVDIGHEIALVWCKSLATIVAVRLVNNILTRKDRALLKATTNEKRKRKKKTVHRKITKKMSVSELEKYTFMTVVKLSAMHSVLIHCLYLFDYLHLVIG